MGNSEDRITELARLIFNHQNGAQISAADWAMQYRTSEVMWARDLAEHLYRLGFRHIPDELRAEIAETHARLEEARDSIKRGARRSNHRFRL